MIYDRKCAVVVMVSGLVEEGQEASAQYWPDQGGLYQYGEYDVELMGEELLDGYVTRDLCVIDTKVLYIYVCIYVCMYVCMNACVYVLLLSVCTKD